VPPRLSEDNSRWEISPQTLRFDLHANQADVGVDIPDRLKITNHTTKKISFKIFPP